MPLIDLNKSSNQPLVIPDEITRDTEVLTAIALAIAAHIAASNPHSQYLSQNGKAADSELIDGINSSRIVFGDDWSKTLGINIDSTINSNSGFLDCYSGGTFPSGTTHINGFQARHRNNTNIWGMQAGCQYSIPNEFYFRTIWGGAWQPWRRVWNNGNFDPTSHAQNFNGTTAKSIGYSGGTIFSETNNCGYEVRARDSSSAAYISFLRPQIFGFHFGMDTDNQLKIGGWSFGGASYVIWHEGNLPIAQYLTRVEGDSRYRPLSQTVEVWFSGALPLANAAGNSVAIGWNSVQPGLGTAEFCNYAGSGGGDAFNFFRMPGAPAARPTLTNRVSRIDVTGNYVATSDRRVKSDFSKAPGLEILSLIKPYRYHHFSNVRYENGEIEKGENFVVKLGFIAQEIAELIPEAVARPNSPEELWGIDYNCLLACAIQSIKELHSTTQELQEQIDGLKLKLQEK
ncbi:tail fiber domain-containing protein [Kamptonema animale CS-326]|uniref:tail fiber domain-containing protein n=1 Tax=Kamptonema animale TaxID=92934 RepID=UPI00232FD4FB|nr:tail fiber domain-containing protein [Kamptonema animale]MDB9510615.1 tail fiber domain-containing protein [Kamptonema animale CS-326]